MHFYLDTKVRDTVSYITQGRVIGRLVSLFEPVETLVDENDRRRRIAVDEDDPSLVDHTLE